MISELYHMAVRLLDNYKESRGKFPDHVVVFRDGISEGQYKTVLKLN